MTETDSLSVKLLEILNQDMGLEVGSADTDLFESGILDSLSLVSLLLHIEARFNVTVALEQLELDNFRSVTIIARFIAACREVSVTSRSVVAPATCRKAAGSPLLE